MALTITFGLCGLMLQSAGAWSFRRGILRSPSPVAPATSAGKKAPTKSKTASARKKKRRKRRTAVAPARPTVAPLPASLLTRFPTALSGVVPSAVGQKVVAVAASLPVGSLSAEAVWRQNRQPAATQLFSLGSGGGFDPATNRIEVPVGMFVTLTKTTDIKTVAVADDKIADVQVISPRAVLINGKSPGVTSLVLHGDKGDVVQQYEVRVVAQSPSALDEIRRFLNMPNVRLSLVRSSVVLEGEVETEEQKKKALMIAQLISPNVVDLLQVREARPQPDDVIGKIQKELNLPGLTVRVVEGKVVLTGEVNTVEEKQRAEGVARLFAKGEAVNLLTIRLYTPEEIESALGVTTVKVRVVRDTIILEGTVESQTEASQIADFVTKRAGSREVLNRIRVVAPPPPPSPPVLSFSEQVQQAIGIPTVRVTGTPNLTFLEGTVENDQQLKKTLAIVENVVGDKAKVQNFIAVRAPDQVRVEVSVVEINIGRLRELGIEYPKEFIYGETNKQSGALEVGASVIRRTPFTFTLRVPPNSRNDVKILSKPNTIVLSGKEAKFQVGGEVPIPSANINPTGQNISASVEFRKFGILLTVTPTVDALGNIHLKINTEVSELGEKVPIIQGTIVSQIPSFLTRTSDTEVHLKDGQTLVLGGLIEHRDEKTVNKFPFLGSIPVLGELFTSRSFQRRETELIIFVTPRLVKPEDEA